MTSPQLNVRRATLADLDALVPLFDAYRQFYRQLSQPERARSFLSERIGQNQSVVFLACQDTTAIGFTQLYPSFSSASMAPIFVLNDLFVDPQARCRGAATALLHAAAAHSRSAGAVRLVLSTELTNTPAQSLYEKLGWKRDSVFCVYQLTL